MSGDFKVQTMKKSPIKKPMGISSTNHVRGRDDGKSGGGISKKVVEESPATKPKVQQVEAKVEVESEIVKIRDEVDDYFANWLCQKETQEMIKHNLKLSQNIPKFYFGKEGQLNPVAFVHGEVSKAEAVFSKYKQVEFHQFGKIITSIGIPLYWKKPLWSALGLEKDDILNPKAFVGFYLGLISTCPDVHSQFIKIFNLASTNFPYNPTSVKRTPSEEQLDALLRKNLPKSQPPSPRFNWRKNSSDNSPLELTMFDFVPFIQDIIDTHPGLGFLRESVEFHDRYITTVISRIFYKVNRSWSGKISLAELRRSNLLEVIKQVEVADDINTVTEYFSYEHFYVIYCKFWELDKDHNLLIDRYDLSNHSDKSLSGSIINRIFSGAVNRGWDITKSEPLKTWMDKMTYSDFVWFLISEEDKKSPTAIEYWFRCLDIDGDGVLSAYELETFYTEQKSRSEAMGIASNDFQNIYCQFVDQLDLKRSPRLSEIIFNTLFNMEKFLEYEQKDPFISLLNALAENGIVCGGGGGDGDKTSEDSSSKKAPSDWDKYVCAEYTILIQGEENSPFSVETFEFGGENSPNSPNPDRQIGFNDSINDSINNVQ